MIFGSNSSGGASQQLAIDMAGGNPDRVASSTWRSPCSNPDLEYVYLGSPRASPECPGSPQPSLLHPDCVITSNPLVLQPTFAGHVYGDGNHHGFPVAGVVPMGTWTQPGFMPVPGVSFQVPSLPQGFAPMNPHKFQPQSPSQSPYPLGNDSTQFDDIWSSLDSDLLDKVTPEDISIVEAYAPPGFDRAHPAVQPHPNYNSWAMNSPAMAEEAQSSNIAGRVHQSFGNLTVERQGICPGGVAAGNAQEYGGLVMDPRLEIMDVVMGDSISESASSTSPGGDPSLSNAQFSYEFGNPGDGHPCNGTPDNVYRSDGSPGHGIRGHGNPGNVRAPHVRDVGHAENNFREQAQCGALGGYQDAKPGVPDFSGGMLAPIRTLGEPRWAEQLLNLCAAAIASKNISRTQHLMWVLNDLASVVGDVNQRFAAYGLRALFCRITGRMEVGTTFLRPRHHDQEVSYGPKNVHRALVKFHEYVPWHQNCYNTTCQTLLEVCAGKSRIHLVDIGAGKGIEWPIFIDALVSRSGGPPSILRITMIRDVRREELNIDTAKMMNSEAADFMTRLVKFASLLGLHVEVNVVQKPLECITREDLKIREGEVLAVVCQFRLHHLSEEPPARENSAMLPRLSPRDEFLETLYKFQPHVFILSENNCDHVSHDFLTRFQNCVGFWWMCYEAMDIGYAGRDPAERQILEYEGSMMILNTVACEGGARIERNEPYANWQRRITRAGFVPRELSEEAKKVSQNLIASHNEFWDVEFVGNMVSLRWRKQPTTFTSVWKTSASCSRPSCKCSMLHG